MVEEDVGQCTSRVRIQCCDQICWKCQEGSIGRGKNSKGAGGIERRVQAFAKQTFFEDSMVGAIGDDVHHGSWRQQYRIDDVYDAIISFQVDDGHLSIVDKYSLGVDGHPDVFSLQGSGSLAIFKVGGEYFSAENVVEEDLRQRASRIGQEFIDNFCRECGKSSVGGSKYGERASGVQGGVKAFTSQ